MLARKIKWTLLLIGLYEAGALLGDYMFNVVICGTPQAFTPWTTALITLFVGVPATFYLLSQRFDLKAAVAERSRLEGELKSALASAESALVVKSTFLANMTHELRTPLNAIIGFSALLSKSASLSDRDAEHAKLINDASQGLLHIVNDVLDYSKLEADALELDHHPFDPLEVVGSAAALFSQEALSRGLVIEVRGEGVRLVSDAGRISQVLFNFLSNAIKFTPKGVIGVSCRTYAPEGARSGRARLRVEVEDCGIGVEPDQLERIFGRFTQADASISRRYGGTGLGLAISKRIIEALGGEIGAWSRPGAGSTFWFEIPAEVAQEGALEGEAETPAFDLADRLRVLLVDDNAANRRLVAAILEPFAIDLETACDGVEAVAASARRDFDVILMDVQMPNMDGLSATARIRASSRAEERTTPIIAMTANVADDQVRRCLAAGMDDHVGKPIAPHQLLSVLERWGSERSPGPDTAKTPHAAETAGLGDARRAAPRAG